MRTITGLLALWVLFAAGCGGDEVTCPEEATVRVNGTSAHCPDMTTCDYGCQYRKDTCDVSCNVLCDTTSSFTGSAGILWDAPDYGVSFVDDEQCRLIVAVTPKPAAPTTP